MNAGRPLVAFRHASLGYDRKAVLTGVDLEVRPGAFIGVLGPNGAGKTTILKTLLGILSPIKGTLETHGSHFGRPRFGYVPQKERLDPLYPLTSFEVAAMGTYRRLELFRRLRGRAHVDLIASCLKDCGVADLGPRRFSDLSGGQKQRVLIARALASEPELLAMDEPLAGIDAATQRHLLKLFHNLREQRGLTMLMISHRLAVERDLFTHIAWVDQGKADWGPSAQMLAKHRLTELFGQES